MQDVCQCRYQRLCDKKVRNFKFFLYSTSVKKIPNMLVYLSKSWVWNVDVETQFDFGFDAQIKHCQKWMWCHFKLLNCWHENSRSPLLHLRNKWLQLRCCSCTSWTQNENNRIVHFLLLIHLQIKFHFLDLKNGLWHLPRGNRGLLFLFLRTHNVLQLEVHQSKLALHS